MPVLPPQILPGWDQAGYQREMMMKPLLQEAELTRDRNMRRSIAALREQQGHRNGMAPFQLGGKGAGAYFNRLWDESDQANIASIAKTGQMAPTGRGVQYEENFRPTTIWDPNTQTPLEDDRPFQQQRGAYQQSIGRSLFSGGNYGSDGNDAGKLKTALQNPGQITGGAKPVPSLAGLRTIRWPWA